MAVSDTLINTLFDGRYRIVRKLGTGGMANVYLAEDEELGRRVAIKILNDRHAGDEQFVERFRREAKNAAGLSHPNIVSIYDRGEAEGTYYIAMEYLDGRTLKELIVSRGPTPIPIAIAYTRQVLAALRFAHRNGIVHRDIKPHNILVDGEGRLKVTDFGIARAGTSQMTEVGSIIGTAQYLSPEQARGAPVDKRSDLYSVGVLLYELLTGTVPFSGDTPVEIAMKHLSETPVAPSSKRADVPRDLDLVVLRALAKDAEDRYASADEMDADLERVARGAGVTPETAEAATAVLARTNVMRRPTTAVTVAAPPRPPTPYAPPRSYYDYAADLPRRRSRPWWPWIVALLLVAGAAVAGWYAYTEIRDQLEASKPITVPEVIGIDAELAKRDIRDEGLRVRELLRASETRPAGSVIAQDPSAGDKIERGNVVTIFVSSGRPKTKVPDVRGKTLADAASALAVAHLEAKVFEVPSNKEPGTITAQQPKPGVTVFWKTPVRINVSTGPKPVVVPPVIGASFETAASQLRGVGFGVTRRDVDSREPKGTVVDQDPDANTEQPKGTTITLSVSKGPADTAVPSVESLEREAAEETLRASGFKVQVQEETTTDPASDGIVLAQEPIGGTLQKAGSVVTIVVGVLEVNEPSPDDSRGRGPPQGLTPP